MQLMMFASAIALIVQGEPNAGELMERLTSEPKAVFDTGKKPYDLELCLADALTLIGAPTVFRDGPDNIVMAVALAGGNAIFATVSVAQKADGSHLELRARGKGWDDRLSARIKTCL
jgi:hypothetical protein